MKKNMSRLLLIAVTLVAGTFVAAAPAYAGCQASSARLTVQADGLEAWFTCSGTFAINRTMRRIDTGGWGGYFTWVNSKGDHPQHRFCDHETIVGAWYTLSVTLSATKPSWC